MEYTCIFDKKAECPVKQEYKLQPESLIEFCKICNKAPSTSENRKFEFEAFLNATKLMGDLSRQLGEQSAKAEMYQKLYEELKQSPIGWSTDHVEAVIKKLQDMGFFKDFRQTKTKSHAVKAD